MPFRLIDTHAHLDDGRFANDLPEVLARAQAVGVERIFTIGIDLETSESAVRLAKQHSLLRAVVGIQPNHVHEAKPGDWDSVKKLAQDETVVALGETGLDRYWDKAPFDLQIDYFDRHLDFARARGLPVVIHCREAEKDVVEQLGRHFAKHGPIAGVMHSFAGDLETGKACLGFGLHISFAGMVTFKNAEALRSVAKEIPADRLLVETDSPYLAPMPHRGKRNEPSYVRHTLELLAETRGDDAGKLAAQTTANAIRLFGLA